MPSEPTKPSNSGIITDDAGERQIPESLRADGTTRKAIKIRPGYRPPEDVEVYKNRTAAAFRDRATRTGIPGAAGLKDDKPEASSSAAANKNAKRREARKKAKAEAEAEAGKDGAEAKKPEAEMPKVEEADPEVEREKKARNLKKKLKQAKDLKNKKEGGETLLPEQIAKVIKINELIRELDALGFDAGGEQKARTNAAAPAPKDDGKDA